MAGKQARVEPSNGRRRWIARVAVDGALALVAGVFVVGLLAIPAVRRIATPGEDAEPPHAVSAASPGAVRAARRREHMARLPRWREIRREAREGGTPPRAVPAPSPAPSHADSAACPSGCASVSRP